MVVDKEMQGVRVLVHWSATDVIIVCFPPCFPLHLGTPLFLPLPTPFFPNCHCTYLCWSSTRPPKQLPVAAACRNFINPPLWAISWLWAIITWCHQILTLKSNWLAFDLRRSEESRGCSGGFSLGKVNKIFHWLVSFAFEFYSVLLDLTTNVQLLKKESSQ